MNRIKEIFLKELRVEFRQKYTLGGIFLFSATVVFLIYKVFNTVTELEWSILLWIITMFSALNAIVKSFSQEKKGTYLYYYSLFDPVELIIGKLIYNTLFIFLLFAAILLFMSLFLGFPVKDTELFFGASFLGIFGLSTILTFISLISTSDQTGSTLMSVLSIPLILPIMLLLLKTTAVSLRLITDTSIDQDVLLLAAIDAIMLGTVIILFPSLWRS
ncbi:MAG: heme exporter protein CcmB [Saprospiraceae bacterium]|nr:heme exporter protein CcmB [Saprospiraceae bacterium]